MKPKVGNLTPQVLQDQISNLRRAAAIAVAPLALNLQYVSPSFYGAKADGVTNDSADVISAITANGIKIFRTGNYITSGTISNFTRPTVMLTDGAQRNGSYLPLLNISRLHWNQLPAAYVFVRQDTSDRADLFTARFEKIVNTDDALVNPQVLRAYAQINLDTTQSVWAVSGVLDNYSDLSGVGCAANSGVANKYGLATVFAGHFQSNDHNTYAAATDVTATVGYEANIQAIGPDHPTANNGLGNRFVADLLGRILSGGSAEIGCILRLRADNETAATIRYALAVTDYNMLGTITTGILIRTHGGRSIYITGNVTGSHIQIAGNSSWGLVLSGTYSTAAIRIPATEYFSWDTTDTIQTTYGATANLLAFYNTGVETFGINMSNGNLRIMGLTIMKDRNTGWTADTGTASKASHATYSGTASVGYVQAEMQALMDAVLGVTQSMKAIKDMGINHGFIGA